MARLETRQPPPHHPVLSPCCRRHAAVVIGSLPVACGNHATGGALPGLGRSAAHAGPSSGPASQASVTTADHVSAGDCASMSTVTRGVAGVARVADAAASLHVSAGLGPGCAPSKFRPSPADPCCCCSRCHRTRCPFQNSVLLPPARLPCPPSGLPSLRACLSTALPSVPAKHSLLPARLPSRLPLPRPPDRHVSLQSRFLALCRLPAAPLPRHCTIVDNLSSRPSSRRKPWAPAPLPASLPATHPSRSAQCLPVLSTLPLDAIRVLSVPTSAPPPSLVHDSSTTQSRSSSSPLHGYTCASGGPICGPTFPNPRCVALPSWYALGSLLPHITLTFLALWRPATLDPLSLDYVTIRLAVPHQLATTEQILPFPIPFVKLVNYSSLFLDPYSTRTPTGLIPLDLSRPSTYHAWVASVCTVPILGALPIDTASTTSRTRPRPRLLPPTHP
jgi:hypothetical protein